jgi:dTDP-glucose pyrophosphorylase/predicted transcriptional regulator
VIEDISHICIRPHFSMRQVFEVLQNTFYRICLITDENGKLLGTITDGDCRRSLLQGGSLETIASEIMCKDFVVVDQSFSDEQIRSLMRINAVKQIPVVDDTHRVVHLVLESELKDNSSNWNNLVLILAGGRGERLSPLTNQIPKPMLPIRGTPMIERLIKKLSDYGFGNIVVSTNYLSHIIEQHLKDGNALGCKIKYLRETKNLGTAGPLKLLEDSTDLPILVVNGDLVTSVCFPSVIDLHSSTDHSMTIGISQYQYKMPFGIVYSDDQGLVQRFEEKPTVNYQVNAGVYAINPNLTKYINPDESLAMNEFIERILSAEEKVGAFPIHEEWLDVGLPQQYIFAQE